MRVAKVLRSYKAKVAHKQIRTISNILKKPKDKIGKEASRGVVYKIKCEDCDSVYFGQTSRALKSRMKEHTKSLSNTGRNLFVRQTPYAPQSPKRFGEC